MAPESVVKDFFTTSADGKQYRTKHYSLAVNISVGYRVKSLRGTQFRIWATQQLRSYLVKGFALDDRRLKEGGSTDRYCDELLERIRNIRVPERMFYRKVADIYATSIDYDPCNPSAIAALRPAMAQHVNGRSGRRFASDQLLRTDAVPCNQPFSWIQRKSQQQVDLGLPRPIC